VLQIASAIVSSGLRDVGYEYVNLDAGVWSPNRTASGEMQPDPAKFPSGMKSLADKLHAMKLKLGVYINLGTDHATCGRLGAYGHYAQDAKTIVRTCMHPCSCDASKFVSIETDERLDIHRPLLAQTS
jgi:alpha-galactosidase